MKTKGELIAYYLESQAIPGKLSEWCENWGIDEDDYTAFMRAGMEAVDRRHENDQKRELKRI